ncbi:restriction endonuclease subunit R [Limnoraphis robusta Tam1]|uniref:restriction endonuclease subunit R n=1 Tax=Limnoraphis robusta TaxID=1118279 RepID=UPI002B21BF8C|nr:restriction endonuclease subunit R [Limnoraphis robusta]MEA5543112.1 restriction endonuclease subunit R [Limnoraphis robusta Tam1]
MVQVLAAKDITLEQLETHFRLEYVEDDNFFWEWRIDLPELNDWEVQLLEEIKAGYSNLIKQPPLLEKPINLTVVSPLLFIGRFYQSPFNIRAEKSVEISAISEDSELIVKGNLDTLVLKDQVWVMVIESKQAKLSVEAGLALILAYMLANPNSHQPSFGLITNGGSFLFLKLIQTEHPQYATSDLFGINNRQNNLSDVLKVLKKLILISLASDT